jgi:integrase
MASIFRRRLATKAGKKRLSTYWYIAYSDEHGQRRVTRGLPGKAETQLMAARIETDVALKRRGIIDPIADKVAKAEARPVSEHLDDWKEYLSGKNSTSKHIEIHVGRVRRLLGLAGIDRLSELSGERVQAGLAKLRKRQNSEVADAWGTSLATLNAYVVAARCFAAWLDAHDRLRKNPLARLEGFNAAEDPRHQRRTLTEAELRRLIEAAHHGRVYARMTGRARALLYRLAATTGLRWSEIAAATPESFHLEGARPFVEIEARHCKNRRRAELALTADLAQDLRAYLSLRAPGTPAFDLPARGSSMLQVDLAAADIPYKDGSGCFYDFHALRCQFATELDRAGASPRTVQHLMRHSSLELTGKYTKPRQHDLDGAVAALPSFRPEPPSTEAQALRATGTCAGAATALHRDLQEERKSNSGKGIRLSAECMPCTEPPGRAARRAALPEMSSPLPGAADSTGGATPQLAASFRPSPADMKASLLPA